MAEGCRPLLDSVRMKMAQVLHAPIVCEKCFNQQAGPKRLHNRERSEVCTNQRSQSTHGSVTNLIELGPNKYEAANEMPYVLLI